MADETVYSAGDLKLEILGFSENAIASIDRTVKSLNALSRSINKINSTQFVYAGDKIEVLFNKISKATNSINTKNLDNLAVSAKALASISKIGNLSNMDFGKVGAGFTQLAIDIKPFINEVKSAEASLTSFYGILSRFNSKKSINTLPKVQNSLTLSSKSFTKGFSNMFGLFKLARWTSVIYMARRLGGYVSNIAQDGADYTETLNLWRVSMGNSLIPQATEFVNKMNEAYGVSEKTLMNAQAIFKNMLGSLGGMSDETAYYLSKGVTQMALDYASLYNQSFDEAFTKFQAALAGQVRPIRSVSGYDITENTLFEVYKSLGGEKTMRQLSQTEKRLLAIYAIFRQMESTGAIGDLDKTMESFANQSRVFADSWNDVKNYAGVLLTYVIQESGIFTKINAGLIFLSELLKSVATSIGAFEEFEDPFASTEESALDTSEAVDELNNKLLDFDKIRALNQSTDVSALGIDIKLLDAFSSYESILEKSKMDARELANTWLENIGLIDQNKDGIIDMQEAIGFLNTKLDEIDFNKIGQGFSNQTSSVLQWFDNLVTSIPWSELGSSLSDFIDGVDWGDVGYKAFNLLLELARGIKTALKTALLEVDWWELLQECFSISPTDSKKSFLEYLIEDNIFGWIKKILNRWESFGGNKSITPLAPIAPFASGGLPDKGSVFIAGEAGAEIAYNMPSGQSGVANVQQIAQATYSGTINALNDWWGGSHARGDIPQLREASATGMYQAVTGVAKSYGERWDKY